MRAAVVATPVLERLRAGPVDGVVRGATARAAYLDLGGFVVALTAPGIPLMPDGVAVDATAVPDGPVRAGPDGIAVGRATLRLEGVRVWDPVLPRAAPGAAPALRARGAAIVAALGPAEATEPGALAAGERGREGLALLRRALAERDAGLGARAAALLIGLGGGLTPEGDDVLTATAAVVGAVAGAAGIAAEERARLVAALVPRDAAARTTALSATLLALAARGCVIEPVHRLLEPAGAGWRDALAILAATGASTGRAYAAAAGSALVLLLGEG
jgi:uncharacterized protein DUF2877